MHVIVISVFAGTGANVGETTFSMRTHNWLGQVHISAVDLPVFLFSAFKVSQSTCRHVSITIVIFHSTDRPTVLSVRVCINFVISSLKVLSFQPA